MVDTDELTDRSDHTENGKSDEEDPARALGEPVAEAEEKASNKGRCISTNLEDGNAITVGDFSHDA